MVDEGIRLDFFIGIDKEKGIRVLQMIIEFLFLDAVGFTAEPLDAVAIHRFTKMAGRYAEANLYRVSPGGE